MTFSDLPSSSKPTSSSANSRVKKLLTILQQYVITPQWIVFLAIVFMLLQALWLTRGVTEERGLSESEMRLRLGKAKTTTATATATTTATATATAAATATATATATFPPPPPPPPRFELVVTILHDHQQSQKNKVEERVDWLLRPSVQAIPVTIVSPDRLKQTDTQYFRPESEEVFGRAFNRSGKVTLLPLLNGGGASEVPGYLAFILNNWDSLPDVSIFLHANPFAHGRKILNNIRYVVDRWTIPQIGFLYLNDDRMICRMGKGPPGYQANWKLQWEILGFDPKQLPKRLKMPCCAQFMVTKERIYLRPKWFYQQALKLAYELTDALFFEHYWHIFWGEQAMLSEDRELPSYINSNWTKPVHDAVLHNPFINVPYIAESMKLWYKKYLANPDSYYPILNESRSMCPPGVNFGFNSTPWPDFD